MLSEIIEMPEKAKFFLENSPAYSLPTGVPYIGMGSSYFASLAFKYMGIDIKPEIASEYFNYLYNGTRSPFGVLLSQSGKSSEVLWCRDIFEKYIAISNNVDSPLCNSASVSQVVALLAGEEKYSSSKTYINTLLALFKGFGINVENDTDLLAAKIHEYDRLGRVLAEEVFELLQREKVNGLYITGSGPNIATAMQAALVLSESTKLNFNGLPMAQYDHGPKETAKDSVVINVIAKGKSYERSLKLGATIKAAGAHVFTVEEAEVTENASILNNIIPFNYMAYYLSKKLNVQEMFVVGGKVTEVL
jgi:glucosamine--fructose-6-phosphate aminotransferase (isomerizing)